MCNCRRRWEEWVIVEVRTNPRKIRDDRDVVRFQQCLGPDPRKLEQLRSMGCTCGNDDLLGRRSGLNLFFTCRGKLVGDQMEWM
jgi:hypothetical protein